MTRQDMHFADLVSRGLSETEANQFMALLNKIELTDEDVTDFNFTMNSPIPFEGGMGFTEGLTGMKLANERTGLYDLNYGQMVLDAVSELKDEKTISLKQIQSDVQNFFGRAFNAEEIGEVKRLFAEQGVTVTE